MDLSVGQRKLTAEEKAKKLANGSYLYWGRILYRVVENTVWKMV
jgi:hypothetical protein